MLSVLTFAWIVISVICLWVLIEQRKKAIFLLFFIPLFLILTTSTYFTVRALFGYSTNDPLPTEFVYISHMVHEPYDIYFWLLEIGSKEPRAYKVPYDKTFHEEANKAQQMTAEGGYVMGSFAYPPPMPGEEGEFKEGGRSEGGRTVGGDLVFYQFEYQKMMPKDYSNTYQEVNVQTMPDYSNTFQEENVP
jgi:hypothetical protein